MWNYNRARISLLALALGLSTLITAWGLTSRSAGVGSRQMTVTTSGKIGTSPGDTAPDFQLSKIDGSTVSSNDLRGQPSVLIFWTAWCPACKEEAPNINRLADRYRARGVNVLGIDIKDSEARTAGGIEEFGIRYPVARDANASVARSYNVIGTPTILFLDRHGIVDYFGHELPEDYEARLDRLLVQSR
jgi:peroxiredoxin